jgi:hypothetical protein
MNRLRLIVLIAMLSVVIAARSWAGEAYVLRVLGGPFPQADGSTIAWTDELLFHNSGAVAVTVSVLGTSNGVQLVNAVSLTIPAGGTRFAPVFAWMPTDSTTVLYVLHLGVPDGITVLSRIQPQVTPNCTTTEPCVPIIEGAALFPVFHALSPAGSEQLLMGADLGDFSVRLNGAFYNGGATTANATVEVRSACDDHLYGTTRVSIPANQVIQVNGLGPIDHTCNPPPGVTSYVAGTAYLRVVMDQPGFSYVSVQENGALPALGLGIATNGATLQ